MARYTNYEYWWYLNKLRFPVGRIVETDSPVEKYPLAPMCSSSRKYSDAIVFNYFKKLQFLNFASYRYVHTGKCKTSGIQKDRHGYNVLCVPVGGNISFPLFFFFHPHFLAISCIAVVGEISIAFHLILVSRVSRDPWNLGYVRLQTVRGEDMRRADSV